MGSKPRISIRLTPNQELVLKEMSDALGVSISMLIRTIVGSWLTTNEDAVYRLIDKKKLESNANYKPITEETEDIFREGKD